MKKHSPDALLAAWDRWDEQPGARAVVVVLQDEIAFAADHVGVSTLMFRRLMVVHGVSGVSRRDALKRVLEAAESDA